MARAAAWDESTPWKEVRWNLAGGEGGLVVEVEPLLRTLKLQRFERVLGPRRVQRLEVTLGLGEHPGQHRLELLLRGPRELEEDAAASRLFVIVSLPCVVEMRVGEPPSNGTLTSADVE